MFQKLDIFDRIQHITESYLTRRARVVRIRREKQLAKNPVLDWVEAFVWAMCVVLIINQYLFQAYQIPSGSMIDTLLIGDRIFVNKIVYGPEILPGIGKISSPIKPKRNDVIIFENPEYNSRGPVFDIAQRIIFMLTISLVDIDRDISGKPKPHFLIKRAVATGGDTVFIEHGDMYIRFAGEDRIVSETQYNKQRGWDHNLSRIVTSEEYPLLEAAGKASAYLDLNIAMPTEVESMATQAATHQIYDTATTATKRLEILCAAFPQENRFSKEAARRNMGRFIPQGRVLPLGDNRDNSHDGRYFGAVKTSKILGKGAFKFWPHTRIGSIE
ncbi:MAG: signal peptidase I [Termitinemataceae bacterium]|nr:MAG: signal peptidase I [Termitinemataceae bacterium]